MLCCLRMWAPPRPRRPLFAAPTQGPGTVAGSLAGPRPALPPPKCLRGDGLWPRPFWVLFPQGSQAAGVEGLSGGAGPCGGQILSLESGRPGFHPGPSRGPGASLSLSFLACKQESPPCRVRGSRFTSAGSRSGQPAHFLIRSTRQGARAQPTGQFRRSPQDPHFPHQLRVQGCPKPPLGLTIH